jgi:hypothetical protein
MDLRIKNMTGKLCGLLTVTGHAGSLKTGCAAVWDCLCQCGNRLIVVGWRCGPGIRKAAAARGSHRIRGGRIQNARRSLYFR